MKQAKQKIGIIGSGITGLSACWLLRDHYSVTLFEKNQHLGGHTHTHDVMENDRELAIDSGFIVYNEKNYPNLVGLFEHLNVATQATDMSFAFSLDFSVDLALDEAGLDKGVLEYSGSGLNGMFAQHGNLLSVRHWRLLKEIVRFNKVAHAALADTKSLKNSNKNGSTLTLGDFLTQHHFSNDLQQHYLLPMGAAIWSCPAELMSDFPAYSFLQFFANHGLIDLKNRPQWRTVIGGSREYVRNMMVDMETDITIKTAATKVLRKGKREGVEIVCEDETHQFDQVIFACHADEALALLDQASADEQSILGCFKYQENKTYLHTDESLMPKRKKAWSSWNYLAKSEEVNSYNNGKTDNRSEKRVTATYWMNRLHKLQADKNYLVTLNPYQKIDQDKIIKKMTYHHPVFDKGAMHAQSRLHEIQGKNNTWFCGSYTGYGFHEDALSSSVAVCESLGVLVPWNESVEPGELSKADKASNAAISLYAADVMHRRYFPQNYRFDYKVFSFLVDIDRMDEATANPLLSHNRFNLFSIHEKDHGARDGTSWRLWINSILDKNSLSKAKHKIKLLCFPRILGYVFNPLCLWYCYGEDDQLYAIVCEVSNTFGEHHHYVLHNDNQPYTGKVKAHKYKNFHVSPFISMDAEYRFILSPPDDKLSIVINEYQNHKLMLTAAQVGKRIPVTSSKLIRQFFHLRLMTLKIMLMIHWQALKIWLRGGTFHKKPQAPKEDFS